MEHSLLSKFRESTKNWYLYLIAGLLLLFVGIWVFTTPLASYVTLSMLFSLSFIIYGILMIVNIAMHYKVMNNWVWTLVFSIIYTLLGVYLIIRPEVSMATLPIIVAIFLLLQSSSVIAHSIEMSKVDRKGWKFVLTMGILGIVFSFILLVNPVLSGISIVVWTGLALVTGGIGNLVLSYRLRKVHKLFQAEE